MTVCKYFLKGTCKFGDNCRFEHVNPNSNDNNPGSDPFATSTTPTNWSNDSHHIDKDVEPAWPLTAVAMNDASQGNILADEFSPDEMRVQAYRAAPPRGTAPDVVQREAMVLSEHKNKVAAARARGKPQPIAARDPFAGGGANGASTPFGNGGSGTPFGSGGGGGPFGGGDGDDMAISSTPNTPFGGAPTNPFGGGASNNNAPSPFGAPTQTPFGNSTQPPTASAPNNFSTSVPQVKQETTLSSRDLAAFNASSFGFDAVPETAPPPRFC